MADPQPSPVAEPLQRPIVGLLWMAGAGLCFVVFNATVKTLGDTIPASQGAFLRFALAVPFFLPALWTLRHIAMPRIDIAFFTLRAVVHSVAVIAWFYAMARIPMAEVTAINYLNPVFVTIGAVVFFGERIAFRRLAAIVVALLGAMLILRPGFRELSMGHYSMVVTALSLSASYLIMKRLIPLYSPTLIVALLTASVTVALLPFAWVVWVPLSWLELAGYGFSALVASGGHYCMARAYQAAPVAVIQPVAFLQLVWASLIGLLVFYEPLDPWVILGGLVIVGAVSFIAWREMVVKRASN